MALIPPHFLDAVTAIGIGDDPAQRHWIGTGFLFGRVEKREGETVHFRTFLVTNKHVLKGLKKAYLRFNAVDGSTSSKDYSILLVTKNGRPDWFGHPDPAVDVAVMPIKTRLLQDELRQYSVFFSDTQILGREGMRIAGVSEGDGIFVLGFPMGMVDVNRHYVICRAGAIARIRGVLEGRTKDFLIDATVFPGNSGGPVITRPEAIAIQGTKATGSASLVGVVKSYVSYSDTAISQQTRKPRITFEENSGLTAVEPVDAILETIEVAIKRLKKRVAWARWKARKTTQASTTSADSTSKEPGTANE